MNNDRDDRLDLLIEQALREFPLEPAPEQLTARILKRIEKPLAVARFRISWVDLALSGALAIIFGIVLEFFQGISRSPYWSTRLWVELVVIWRDIKYFLIHHQSPLIAALLSAGVVFSLLAVLASVYWRYTADTRRLPV